MDRARLEGLACLGAAVPPWVHDEGRAGDCTQSGRHPQRNGERSNQCLGRGLSTAASTRSSQLRVVSGTGSHSEMQSTSILEALTSTRIRRAPTQIPDCARKVQHVPCALKRLNVMPVTVHCWRETRRPMLVRWTQMVRHLWTTQNCSNSKGAGRQNQKRPTWW